MRAMLACFFLSVVSQAQDPFKPMDMEALATPTRAGVREDWVRVTNQRLELGGKTLRVAQGRDGLTAVFLARGVTRPRHAKPLLLGKGEHALLFRTAVGAGFNRLVVRNPDTGQEWAARLEQGKAILEKP